VVREALADKGIETVADFANATKESLRGALFGETAEEIAASRVSLENWNELSALHDAVRQAAIG